MINKWFERCPSGPDLISVSVGLIPTPVWSPETPGLTTEIQQSSFIPPVTPNQLRISVNMQINIKEKDRLVHISR